ncbi:MAG: hypothetical protein M3N23_02175 [Pseudomonadota bacterium]|nr:hypothetical protein [Pseudomonadota bacterium]
MVALLAALCACKPAPTAAPTASPDLLEHQRAALEKARALDGQLKEQLGERMKSVDQGQ